MKREKAQAAVDFLLDYLAEGEVRIDENFQIGTPEYDRVHEGGNPDQVGVVFRDGNIGAVSLIAAAMTVSKAVEAIDRRIRNAEPEDKRRLQLLRRGLLEEVVPDILVHLPMMVQMREDGSGIVF